jgi:predicted GNAT family acetyltransferase
VANKQKRSIMTEIKLELDKLNTRAFNVYEEGQKAGTLLLNIADDKLMAFHTEVAQESRGKGYAQKLFDEMVAYIRNHRLKVVSLCPYIRSQFKKEPDKYQDIWEKMRSN